jgi:hypothetical protein
METAHARQKERTKGKGVCPETKGDGKISIPFYAFPLISG